MFIIWGVSLNGGTPKTPIFDRVFHYKPSILGYHYFRKHPCAHAVTKSQELMSLLQNTTTSDHQKEEQTNSQKSQLRGFPTIENDVIVSMDAEFPWQGFAKAYPYRPQLEGD